MRSYEILIGLRYTHAKRRNNYISFISIVSMAGLALGVAALIVVLSVMNGFQQELRKGILGVVSHLEVTGATGSLDHWPQMLERLGHDKDVVAGAPYVLTQAMLTHGDAVRGAMVRGILPEYEDKVADLGQHVRVGHLSNLQPGEFGIVLGSALAQSLDVSAGDKVVLITPQGNVTPAGIIPRLKQFTVVGIFQSGVFEYDAGLALIHLQDAQKLTRMGEAVSGLRLKLTDLFLAPSVAKTLEFRLGPQYYVSDWSQSHANFFRAVAIEKKMMFLILLLIVTVAAFNIVSTLVMAVTDKQSDIAILRTLGARPGSIMKIFVIQGSSIGILGTLVGITLGVLLALNLETVVPILEKLFGFDLFPADVYQLSGLPSQLNGHDVWVIGLVSLLISITATLYPSWRASKLNPAESLRYE
ncbi:MAG: lipoprotein-releasing ABC transporter permease subunit [Thiobacillaceae bacterium]